MSVLLVEIAVGLGDFTEIKLVLQFPRSVVMREAGVLSHDLIDRESEVDGLDAGDGARSEITSEGDGLGPGNETDEHGAGHDMGEGQGYALHLAVVVNGGELGDDAIRVDEIVHGELRRALRRPRNGGIQRRGGQGGYDDGGACGKCRPL